MNSQAHINYIIDYDFINIFRIWIFYKNIIISIYNVIFDEQIFFNEKSENLFSQMIVKMNNLIIKIQLSQI